MANEPKECVLSLLIQKKSKHDGRLMERGIQLLPPLWKLPADEWIEALLKFTAWARKEAVVQKKDWQKLYTSSEFSKYTKKEERSYHVNRAIFRDSWEWKLLDEATRETFPKCLRCRGIQRLVTDHIVAVWHRPDWRNDPNNLQTLCWDCNTRKGIWAFDFRPE